jgi:glycosyltransferase involved in cell wall biosynthesis
LEVESIDRVDGFLPVETTAVSVGHFARPLRIAVVAACPFPLPRGTPIRILRLSEALAARGHEVHIATYHLGSGPVAPAIGVHRIDDVRSYQKLSPGPTYGKLMRVDPKLGRLLRRLLRSRQFDVIHAHHYEGLLVSAAARAGSGVPLIYDAHTLLASELPFYSLGIPKEVMRRLGRRMDGWMPRLAEHAVCVTETIRDKLVRDLRLDSSRVSVVANGVEVEHFDPATVTAPVVRPGRSVMFTGNLAEYQGIDLMLMAFQFASRHVEDARLVIVTDSPFTPYESLARQLGIRDRIDIVPSPSFDALPRLLVGANVAVNPRTDCDGVPVKLLNYMAAARAVVSFDGSAPGVEHGRTGWLAPSGDVEALGQGIVELLQQPERARAIGAAAREYIVRHCSWDMAAQRCEDVYRQLDPVPR